MDSVTRRYAFLAFALVFGILAVTLAVRSGRQPVSAASTGSQESGASRAQTVRVGTLTDQSGGSSSASGRADTFGLRSPGAGTDRRLRGPDGSLTSGSLATSGSIALAAADEETSEARLARWKELDLQVVPGRIVDAASSQPLEGVRVMVDGVHMGQQGKNNAHGGWRENRYGPAPSAVTEHDGRALLASPVIIDDLTEATGISFTASKPGYAKRRIFDYPVDGTERDETLHGGSTVWIGAWAGTPGQRIVDFVPTISGRTYIPPEEWSRLHDGRQVTNTVPAGNHAVTLEYKAPDGTVWNSETILFQTVAGETKELEIELRPALMLHGRLSDNVPRPVKGGRVVANCQWPPPGTGSPYNGDRVTTMRQASADVAEDGSFTISGLPAGAGEIIGLCDGFVAAYRTPGAKPYEQNQIYELKAESESDAPPFVLQMEPAGELRIRAVDAAGHPISGATINTWPNVFWSIGVSTIYVDGKIWSADTDADGYATVKRLRQGKNRYYVMAKGWRVPVSVDDSGRAGRELNATIVAGQTSEATVTLEPAPDEEEAGL